MTQLKALWGQLNNGQRISIVLVFLAVVGGLIGFLRWSKEGDFKPLYTDISGEDAGAVLTKIKESGVEYRVTGGGSTILVPSAKVAELRLSLAAAGLPKTGRIGYELFDRTNFGITDFAEQVNYHRALEGEVERSVRSIDEVESARVHLTLAKNSLFLDQKQPAKASVLVKLKPGRSLKPGNIVAITHLVASAVEGLSPEGVSVLDMNGTLLSRPNRPRIDDLDVSDSTLDYKQRIERDLLAKIHTSLEPVVGPDQFRAAVSADCDFTSGEQSEESFDPNRSVMVTAQKTEDISGSNATAGVPGTASNLPRPTSRPGPGSTGVTRRTENITYQSSRLVKRTKIPQGAVKRLSVSVLVAQSVRWQGTGAKAKRVVDPPSPEKMKVIRDLVAGVVGLQTDRGDQLIVETLPWDSSLRTDPPPAAAPVPVHQPATAIQIPTDPKILGAIAGGLAFLILVAVVLKKRRSKKTLQKGKGKDVAVEERTALPEAESTELATTVRSQMEQKLADQAAEKERQELEVLNSLKLPQIKTQKTEVLSKHLSTESKKDPMMMAQVLRAWLAER
jgi:flagellar M-ring protein FliF